MPLYIVSTPIGNLQDITFRAVKVLQEVDFICAEDTRTSKILLSRYQTTTPLISFHTFTSDEKRSMIIKRLHKGESAALISEAGTPGISDPGWRLISEAIAIKIPVIPIPGPSAFLTALQGSGLPMNTFVYLGFLPLKKGRQTLFKALREEKRTVIFYESPRRVLKTLEDLSLYLPKETPMVIARELTKIHETYLRGSISELIAKLKNSAPVKGEVVILFHL